VASETLSLPFDGPDSGSPTRGIVVEGECDVQDPTFCELLEQALARRGTSERSDAFDTVPLKNVHVEDALDEDKLPGSSRLAGQQTR
jgi:hypothetical protein